MDGPTAALSSRLRERTKGIDDGGKNGNREEKQAALMRHKLASKRATDLNPHKQDNSMPSNVNVSEIEAYPSNIRATSY